MTEIQRVPGVFNITDPEWPSFTIPDTVTGLLYDWHADDLTPTASLTSWTDRIGGQVLTNTGTVPVVDQGAHNAVQFTTTTMMRSLTAPLIGHVTIAVVAKLDPATVSNARFASQNSPNYRSLRTQANGLGVAAQFGGTINATTVSTDLRDNQWRVYVAVFDETTARAYIDSGTHGNVVSGTNTLQQDGIVLGNRWVPDSGMTGDMRRATYWNRALSPSDVATWVEQQHDEFGF